MTPESSRLADYCRESTPGILETEQTGRFWDLDSRKRQAKPLASPWESGRRRCWESVHRERERERTKERWDSAAGQEMKPWWEWCDSGCGCRFHGTLRLPEECDYDCSGWEEKATGPA